MAITTTFETRKLDQLRNHPLNAKVFGELAKDGDDADFVASIKAHGVLQPLVVTKDNLILSGHRRRQAAGRAGLKEVPVIVRHDLNGGLATDFAWFETNRNREMTTEQRARWYETRAKIEEIAAKEREQAGGGDKRSDAAKAAEKSGTEKIPYPIRKGEAKALAAADAGMSKHTAEKAVEVVHKIDEAEAAGDEDTAADLRETLNTKSVAAAHRKATGAGKPRPVKFADNEYEAPLGKLVRFVTNRFAACGGTECRDRCEKHLDAFLKSLRQWQKDNPS